jgi:hypothetical protein
MLAKAIEKLKAEIEKEKNDINIKYVGEFLIEKLNTDPVAVEKILVADKTIKGSIAEMRKIAQKRQIDRCGMVNPEEGFGIVLKYFGIDSSITNKVSKVQEPIVEIPIIKKEKSNIEFKIELDF